MVRRSFVVVCLAAVLGVGGGCGDDGADVGAATDATHTTGAATDATVGTDATAVTDPTLATDTAGATETAVATDAGEDVDTAVATDAGQDVDTAVATDAGEDAEVAGEVVTPCGVPGGVPCDDPLAALSDDFEDAASLARWRVLSDVLGQPSQHDLLDIDTTVPGALVIDPNRYQAPHLSGDAGPGWFEDHKGPFLFQELSGDFVVVAHVRMATVTAPDASPTGQYNSGGFVVRDPASDDPEDPTHVGDERWVMHNIGFQAAWFGSETKTTFPDGERPGPLSDSSLFLTPLAGNAGRLALCRIGSRFHFFHDMDAAPGWQAETHTPANLAVNNAWLASDALEAAFDRPDIGADVQVGFVVNRCYEGGAAPRMIVEWVTFATPASLADCTPP